MDRGGSALSGGGTASFRSEKSALKVLKKGTDHESRRNPTIKMATPMGKCQRTALIGIRECIIGTVIGADPCFQIKDLMEIS